MFVEIDNDYLKIPPPIPFVVCRVGEAFKQPPICRPEGTWYHQVLLVIEGEGFVQIGEQTYVISQGQGVFWRADVAQIYKPAGPCFRTMWVTFLGAESILDHYQVGEWFQFEATELLYTDTCRLLAFCEGSSTIFTRSAAGYTWLIDWLQGCFEHTAPVEIQVKRYLEVHFAEPLGLDKIAASVHMSRFALCHYYKEACGITVMEELKRIRLAKARQLLKFDTAPIEEIGRLCGFENPSYFGKLFRAETGRSPREYRQDKNV